MSITFFHDYGQNLNILVVITAKIWYNDWEWKGTFVGGVCLKHFLAKIRNRFLAPVTGKVDEIDQKIKQTDQKIEHIEQAMYLFRDSVAEGLVRRIETVLSLIHI